ncbi:T9SS type A sorting domain-containing protein [uncultured Lacinutrix sp.]|uniref:T9SS type A sorting domain-containing protein n=1 Tax=uncultured Lacinutrix sp. TaxID=574032 RepID=UPI00262623CC|nr:T9SS type A sorting domain-containing protein [uncultured Lacinutrix sp.]
MKTTLLYPSRKSTLLASLTVLFSFIFSIQSYATTDCGHISGFQFSNGNSSVDIVDGGTYSISDLPSNFYIDVLVTGYSESARITVKNKNTGQYVTVFENYLPYTFPNGGSALNYGPGKYRVYSKIYKYNNCQSSSCDFEYVDFTLTNTPPCGQIEGLEFSNGTDTVAIVNGGSYDLGSLPSNFYIDVKVSGLTESAFNRVRNLDTGEVFTNGENVLPYTYPSGNAAWNLGTGTFQFYSEIFKYNNCQGTKCDHICITFTITEDTCGEIAEYQFANGTDAITIVDGETYNINDLPADFYINGLVSGNSESFGYKVTNLGTGEVYNIIENYIDYTFPAGNAAWFLGTGTFEVQGSLFSGNYCGGTKCDDETITFTLEDVVEEVCQAAAGNTITDETVFLIAPGVDNPVVTIIPGPDTVLPENYSYATLLSKNNVIRYMATGLSLELVQPGNSFKVHLLVYDPTTLDINTITLGVTTTQDILDTITNNDLCASLDSEGVAITIINGGVDEKMAVDDVKVTVDPIKNNTQIVSIDEKSETISGNIDIKLYPNPVVDDLNVELLLLDSEVMNYNMVDLNGRQVLSGSFDNSTFGKTKIDARSLASGLYILSFKSNFRTFSKKIQINK